MIDHIHDRLFCSRTAFAYASIAGLVIGLGDLFATSADIIWLVGDMSHGSHSYHWAVGVGLVIALLVMIASFIWLYRGIHLYLIKKAKKAHVDTQTRIEIIEAKLDAIQFFMEHTDIDDEQMNLCDPNLKTLLQAFQDLTVNKR